MNRTSLAISWNLLFVLLAGIVGMALVFYATTWGPTVYSDSVYYLGSADNLVHGRGFGLYWGDNHFRPFAGDPPFYPYVVAFFQLSGIEVVTAARWVGILSFALIVTGSGWLAYFLSRSQGLGIGTSLFLFFPALQVSTNATSEVVFFPATLLGSMLVLYYLKANARIHLIWAAVLTAAAFLSRYVGITLLVAAVLALMLFSSAPWKKRLIDSLIFSVIVVVPMLLWLGWGYFHTQMLGERVMHTPDIVAFAVKFRLALAEIVWNWASLPSSADYEIRKWWMLFLVVLLAVTAGWALWRSFRKKGEEILWLWSGFFALYALVYLIIYFGAYVYTVPTPDLIRRIFDPFLLASGLSLLGLLVLAFKDRRPTWLASAAAIILALVFMVPAIPASVGYLTAMHHNGSGYTSRAWLQSPVLAAVKELPSGIQIITNQPDAVLFLTGRPAHWIPEVVSKEPVTRFTRFGDGGTYQENVFRDDSGALVLFPGMYWQMQGIYYDQTEERIASMLDGLTVHRQFDDHAGIYFYPDQ